MGPLERQSSGVICIWKIYQLFCDSGTALADFFPSLEMLPNVSFISMVIKKVFLSVSIATISTFLQKGTLWRHNYGTSQPKFGQCGVGMPNLKFKSWTRSDSGSPGKMPWISDQDAKENPQKRVPDYSPKTLWKSAKEGTTKNLQAHPTVFLWKKEGYLWVYGRFIWIIWRT